jgi:hypothetical protein
LDGSSSGMPGDCATPSRVMKVLMAMVLMCIPSSSG